ncbi:MAG TPA: cupredoxin domain-containing protein [Acidimicrobiales bacterium]|nr:cupredoxin domain-containing protein [Acidimicrobiales bacterium]
MTMYRPLIGGIALALGLTACGDDDAATAPSSTPRSAESVVEVVATDIAFDADAYEASAGTVTIEYRNDGAIPHTLVIEDVAGFKLDVPNTAAEDKGTTDLESGDYVLYCDIPGHRDAGMEATLSVA